MSSYTFPQYRKTSNNKNHYKILSLKEFIEIQIIGTKSVKYHIVAEQYPEMVRITDMLECNGYELASETEFTD